MAEKPGQLDIGGRSNTYQQALDSLLRDLTVLEDLWSGRVDRLQGQVRKQREEMTPEELAQFTGSIRECRQRLEDERDRQIKLDAWRRLSARTTHRIDNQLFAASGALRSLKAETGSLQTEEVLDIEACLERIGRICAEFRRFSTEQPPKPKPTDVRLLLQEAVRRYSKSAEGIEIKAELPALLPECQWDLQLIEQAVTELLENAIRHTPKGKKVSVRAEPSEMEGRQYLRIIVRNDGKGIEAKYKGRLFEPFFSLRPGGTGLGLALVSQIIKNHKGTIRETGEPGSFARFEIEIPARPFEEDSDESPGD